MIRSLWIAVTALSILASAPPGAVAAEAPWYQFEIIIFERIAKGAGSTEVWPEDPGMPSNLDAIPMRIYAPRTPDNKAKPVAYKALPKSAWQLTELEQHLRRSRNYRPHVHLAWRQQMVHPDKAQLLYIEMMDKQDARNRVKDLPKIEGTLKIGVKRYLHLETDLLLRRLKTGEQGLGGYKSYRLQSKRHMRSGKLHYLDHPVIGVLFLASRYKRPEPIEPETPVTTEPKTTEPAAEPAPAKTKPPQTNQ